MLNLSKLTAEQPLFSMHEQQKSLHEFVNDITQYRARINHYRKNSEVNSRPLKVLLFHPDPYQFAVRLFALSLESADIYFPSNGQVETLNSFTSIVSVFAGSVEQKISLPTLESLKVDNVIEHHFTGEEVAFNWPATGNLYFSTSGSTGQAKLIHKRWEQLNLELIELQKRFNLTVNHTIISTVSHQHIYGLLFRLLWPLSVGAQLGDTFEYPEHILSALGEMEQVVLVSSPAFFKRLINDNVLIEKRQQFSQLFSSGGMLTDDVAISLKEQLNIGATQVYGSTETGGIAYRQVDSLPAAQWHTFTGVMLSVDNKNGQLILQSPWVSESPMLLDDTGKLTSPTRFTLTGRADRTVKLEEKRVNLTSMEVVVNSHAWVKESRVFLKQGKRDLLYAVVSLSALGLAKKTELTAMMFTRELKNHLLSQFELVCLPKKWRYLSELPYNSQGKLVQFELEKLFE